MTRTIATEGKFILETNGNHAYYTRRAGERSIYRQFAGRTLKAALAALAARAKLEA